MKYYVQNYLDYGIKHLKFRLVFLHLLVCQILIFLEKNFLFAVVTQDYVTDVPKVFVINGNSALLKCVIPSIVADFISVESWTDDADNEFFSNSNYGR